MLKYRWEAILLLAAKQMKFLVNIDRDEDGVWIVDCPSIPGCVSQGITKDGDSQISKMRSVHASKFAREQGLPLTVETRQVEVQA